jgi:type IV pilus assembly protein PilM
MASSSSGVWGIDLGLCALKAIRLQNTPEGVKATAFDYIEHPKILSQPDADPDQLTREALEQFLSRNNIKGDQIVISVPGQSGLARFVKLPPVEEKKIAEIVKFEAKQQIPFPLDEVVWDFQRIGTPIISDGLAMETEIGLFAMKKDMVNRSVQQFRDVLVETHIVQMAPLALINYVAYDLLKKDPRPADADGSEETPAGKECVVALDIGTDNSNLVITDGEKVIWQRAVPLGGNHFTRALTKDMKLTFAKAEHLKRNAVKSPDLRKILASLRSVLNDFVGEVQRSLGYFTNTHRDATILYMVGLGGGFRLPGLQKFLQEKLQLEVRKVSRFERLIGEEVLSAPQFTENILSFAVPYGLAIQGLKLSRLQTNLLPHEVRMERMIRGKKPWAAAAAAALLIAVAGLSHGRNLEQKAVNNPEIKKAQEEVNRVWSERQAKEAALVAAQAQLVASRESLRRVVSGIDERFNWRLMMEYINCVLPQPPCNKLVDKSSSDYPVASTFCTDDAKAAYVLLELKKTPSKADSAKKKEPGQDAKDEEFIKKHLNQISIEGVHALWTDDVPSYFAAISQLAPALPGMLDEERQIVEAVVKGKDLTDDQKKRVPDKVWAIEIRGYTYRDKADVLIMQGLMENLRYPEMVNPQMFPYRYAKESERRGRKVPGPAAPQGDEKRFIDMIVGDPFAANKIPASTSFLFLLKNEIDPAPVPGEFKFIDSSYLPSLVAVAPPTPQPGDPSAGPAATPTAKFDRSNWAPIGEIANRIHGGGGAGPLVGAFGQPAKKGKKKGPVGFAPIGPGVPPIGPAPVVPVVGASGKQPRLEFVVLFLWKEPLRSLQPLPDDAVAKKD